jgi:hypothetical protein
LVEPAEDFAASALKRRDSRVQRALPLRERPDAHHMHAESKPVLAQKDTQPSRGTSVIQCWQRNREVLMQRLGTSTQPKVLPVLFHDDPAAI